MRTLRVILDVTVDNDVTKDWVIVKLAETLVGSDLEQVGLKRAYWRSEGEPSPSEALKYAADLLIASGNWTSEAEMRIGRVLTACGKSVDKPSIHQPVTVAEAS